MKRQQNHLSFTNFVVDKKQLKNLIIWSFRNYGIARASNMVDKLKDLGFFYATKAGISLSLEDLRIPPMKKKLLEDTKNLIYQTEKKYNRGEITAVERFQKVIDTWNSSSEILKKEVINYFKITDPLNTIYMMAFSGARGNISQVRQLVGMRGLMSDPQGQIIDLPIATNFREGLTMTDYFISSYGARKGLVDTALRTADSGYLTRRLVDVAQDIIIRDMDCGTTNGILIEKTLDNGKAIIDFKQALIGRILAEDIFMLDNGNLVALANQPIDDILADHIIKSNISKVLVRSPVTCEASNSVCQKCYGWNLAHGKLVDIGEAVGIIAAQSIGEPGTQLTMRTFHTGGVFTGEFAEKFFAPFDSFIEYANTISFIEVRTRHGDQAYQIRQNSHLILHQKNTKYSEKILLSQGTILLVNNQSFVIKGQIIFEYPLKNRLLTEVAQKSIISDISGKVYFSDLMVEEVANKQQLISQAKTNGLLWVLSAQAYHIPNVAKIMVKLQAAVKKNDVLASTIVKSRYSGFVRILPVNHNKSYQEVLVIVASYVFEQVVFQVSKDQINSHYTLFINSKDQFLLTVLPNQPIINNQIIGELISDAYHTKTGGIIKYLDLDVTKLPEDNTYNILSPGYILWIAEETHEINKDVSLLLVKQGDLVVRGTKILDNLIAGIPGIIDLYVKDNLVKEVTIKPYESLHIVNNKNIRYTFSKRGFLRPGEIIIGDIKTDKLVYWEYIKRSFDIIILIRPVTIYSVPKKAYALDNRLGESINLHIARRTTFKDGERVKSVQGINLVTTYLVVNFKKDLGDLMCFIEAPDTYKSSTYFKFIVADQIILQDHLFKSINTSNTTIKNHILIDNNHFIKKDQIIVKTELLSNLEGRVINIENKEPYYKKILMLTSLDCCKIELPENHSYCITSKKWFHKGEEILEGVYAPESGQVFDFYKNTLVLRKGKPYLISSGSILHVNHDDIVQKGENIATLIFNTVKTGDIVQGLPRIEEILEARKRNDVFLNPHALLDFRFNFYLNLGLNLDDATRKSLEEVQLLLLKEVQLVYCSQNVDIADKHVEVIVRQMTSKVKIEKGGDTKYLPGEIISLQKIEAINQSLFIMNKILASYRPVLLGITKASLNTESFISAASFQETTKVLTDAAISGKLDWLKGLKENVIIGRLIPAGTGFDSSNKNTVSEQISWDSLSRDIETKDLFTDNLYDFDDIILDDRTNRTKLI